jgi:hypothetical protein
MTFIKKTRSTLMYFIELLDDIKPYEKIFGWKMRAKKYISNRVFKKDFDENRF